MLHLLITNTQLACNSQVVVVDDIEERGGVAGAHGGDTQGGKNSVELGYIEGCT